MCSGPFPALLIMAALTLLSVGSAYGGFDPAQDPALLGWWSFDEGSGTVAADRSPHGNNGTLNGGAAWVPGLYGTALQFNGQNAYVGTGKSLLNGLTGFTMAGWVSAGNTGVYSSLFGQNDLIELGFTTENGGQLGTWMAGNNWAFIGAKYSFPYPSWHHVALAGDQNRIALYIDGQEQASDEGGMSSGTSSYFFSIGGNVFNATGNWFRGEIDDVWLFSRALTEAEIRDLMKGPGGPGLATDPRPADAAVDVTRDVVLGWTAGEYAQTHNVYLGTSFADVNDAYVTKAVSKGQTGTSFQPASLLEYGRTYYWRVDEVNAPPSAAVFKGGVWSFTVEPYAYPITNIKATASSSDKAANGPQNTVNGSGLTNGGHSTAITDMWVTKVGAAGPAWIQFEFDRPYALQEMLVWNYNVDFELVLGYGFKDVTVEYSLNGTDWTLFGDTQFAQATAQSGYAPTAAIPLNGIYARFIRFSPKSNWSLMGLKQYGLSEVQFFQVPVLARAPQPADGAAGVALEPTLSWRPGREAVSQKVYFGTDRQAVSEGTASSADASGNSYQPGSLDYGRVYYWRVDEVNEAASPSIRTGDVWSFSTTEFFAVDDFESYNDQDGTGTRIYESWIDGYADRSSGSMVGNLAPPFAEQSIVHSGGQSLPMDYNNVVAPFFSEAVRTFSPVQDWTAKGVTDLILWVRGYQAPMAPVIETGGKMTVTGEGVDIWDTADQFTFVCKTLSGDGSLITRVTSKGTGSNTWAKGGVMIRDSLEAGSPHAMMVLTDNSDGAAGNGASFQYRLAADATSGNGDAQTAIKVPYYVKIERKGDSLSGAVSPEGNTWTAVGSMQYISMTAPVYIGICVTSHAAGENRTYVFENIKTTGASGSWQTKEVGLARNSPQDLYVVVEDAAGKSAGAAKPDLVTAGQWTEWRIPLSNLTGVNLTKVKKLYIGVGDRTNPQADGTGKIYLDDIRVGVKPTSVN